MLPFVVIQVGKKHLGTFSWRLSKWKVDLFNRRCNFFLFFIEFFIWTLADSCWWYFTWSSVCWPSKLAFQLSSLHFPPPPSPPCLWMSLPCHQVTLWHVFKACTYLDFNESDRSPFNCYGEIIELLAVFSRIIILKENNETKCFFFVNLKKKLENINVTESPLMIVLLAFVIRCLEYVTRVCE